MSINCICCLEIYLASHLALISMASKSHQLHFILFPYMAQGHMIPMVDIARLLPQHGVIITIITSPLNSKRLASTLARTVESGLQVHHVKIPFPSEEAGLPKGCENLDMLPTLGLGIDFVSATNLLKDCLKKSNQGLIA